MSEPAPITEAITFFDIADLSRSHRFYAETLGFELVVDQGSCRVYRVVAGAYFGICERPDDVTPGTVILTLVTDDVDAWFDRAVAAGAAVERAPAPNPHYAIYNAFVRDPDGYLVEIQRFDDPGWHAG